MKSSLQIYKIELASLGFAFTSLFVALGIEQVINPPRRAIGFAGSELLVIFGPAWLYWMGWLTRLISKRRLLGSIYPRKAKFTVLGYYLLFAAVAVIAVITG
jgi:hypothetical protein